MLRAFDISRYCYWRSWKMVIPMVKQFSSSISFYFFFFFFFPNILKEKREKIKIDLKNWEKF